MKKPIIWWAFCLVWALLAPAKTGVSASPGRGRDTGGGRGARSGTGASKGGRFAAFDLQAGVVNADLGVLLDDVQRRHGFLSARSGWAIAAIGGAQNSRMKCRGGSRTRPYG
jgi:hypothetical protein